MISMTRQCNFGNQKQSTKISIKSKNNSLFFSKGQIKSVEKKDVENFQKFFSFQIKINLKSSFLFD
jgi:hypothetical protein